MNDLQALCALWRRLTNAIDAGATRRRLVEMVMLHNLNIDPATAPANMHLIVSVDDFDIEVRRVNGGTITLAAMYVPPMMCLDDRAPRPLHVENVTNAEGVAP